MTSRFKDIAIINNECFLSDDYYSNEDTLQYAHDNGLIESLTVNENKKIVGYILFVEFGTHIESVRRALTSGSRGKGLGVKLSKKLISTARKKRKSIYTYVSKTNLPSLNSNLKVGYKITDIDENFVYLVRNFNA